MECALFILFAVDIRLGLVVFDLSRLAFLLEALHWNLPRALILQDLLNVIVVSCCYLAFFWGDLRLRLEAGGFGALRLCGGGGGFEANRGT